MVFKIFTHSVHRIEKSMYRMAYHESYTITEKVYFSQMLLVLKPKQTIIQTRDSLVWSDCIPRRTGYKIFSKVNLT